MPQRALKPALNKYLTNTPPFIISILNWLKIQKSFMFVIQVDIGVGTESMSEPLKSSLTVALTGSVP